MAPDQRLLDLVADYQTCVITSAVDFIAQRRGDDIRADADRRCNSSLANVRTYLLSSGIDSSQANEAVGLLRENVYKAAGMAIVAYGL